MDKKPVIVISLVDESIEKTNKDIEKEIIELSTAPPKLPWLKNVKKVFVIET